MMAKMMDHVVQKPDITGSTTINHAARVQLGLNCSEYVLMSFVFHCARNNRPLITMEVYQKTGFVEEEQLQVLRGLVQKGFVLFSPNEVPQITTKWESAFTDIEDEFENLFWKKDGKVIWQGSSRKQSLGFYIKARKKYPRETLIEARNDYVEYLEWEHKRGFDRQIMGAEKFLNEKNEYYMVDWKTMTEGIRSKLEPKKEETKPVEPLTAESRKKMYNE
jgi:hypothetical protein